MAVEVDNFTTSFFKQKTIVGVKETQKFAGKCFCKK